MGEEAAWFRWPVFLCCFAYPCLAESPAAQGCGAGIKIFFPTYSFSAFNPGLALRICATVTLIFFSRYACATASSVSPDLITYSKPLSGVVEERKTVAHG